MAELYIFDDYIFFPLIWHIMLELLTCKKREEYVFSSGGVCFFFITWNCIFFISSGSAHPLYFLHISYNYLYIDISGI